MDYIRVKNWDEFQHYKDRTPPWIKLYNHLLDDFEFSCLPDASKAHLLAIWLLASRTGNRIPSNSKWISNKINATENVDIDMLLKSGFIETIPNENNELHTLAQDASNMLHKAEQDACLEREERERREREDNKKKLADFILQEFERFWSGYHKKSSKKQAEKAFIAAVNREGIKDVSEFSDMLINDCLARVGKQFGFDALLASTYLNGNRWEDEAATGQSNKPSASTNMDWARDL